MREGASPSLLVRTKRKVLISSPPLFLPFSLPLWSPFPPLPPFPPPSHTLSSLRLLSTHCGFVGCHAIEFPHNLITTLIKHNHGKSDAAVGRFCGEIGYEQEEIRERKEEEGTHVGKFSGGKRQYWKYKKQLKGSGGRFAQKVPTPAPYLQPHPP